MSADHRLQVGLFHNLHSGGGKRVAAEQLHWLSTRHQVTLFSLSSADQRFGQAEIRAGYASVLASFEPLPALPSPFGRLNPLVLLANLARLAHIARRLALDIDRLAPDAVIVHPCQLTQAPLLLPFLHAPTIYYCHELPRRLYEPSVSRPYARRSTVRRQLDRLDPLPVTARLVLRSIDRRCARSASRILTNSHYTQTQVERAYGRGADVCYLGVDVDAFFDAGLERQRWVLSVGALTPMKAHDFIIQALSTLPRRARPPLMVISNYQEPDEWRYLNRLADECEVQLECRVGVAEHELRAAYATAGCVAYAPIREPFGLVAIEAMACGAPIVAVAEGGVRESVMDNMTGLLTPRDALIFGQALDRVLSHPKEARRLGQCGRRHAVEQWAWPRHMGRLEEHLESLTNAHRN
jgi:glycosyltransferase involved in cell wall biosynthesis